MFSKPLVFGEVVTFASRISSLKTNFLTKAEIQNTLQMKKRETLYEVTKWKIEHQKMKFHAKKFKL